MVSVKRSKKGDSTQLLTVEQKESSFNNKATKKKGMFSVFKKKSSKNEYEPPATAPNTPEAPISVSVVESEFDPAKPYGLASRDATISALTDRDGAISPHSMRKVGFDLEAEDADADATPTENTQSKYSYSRSLEDPTALTSLDDPATLASIAETRNSANGGCTDNIMNQTLGFFEDLCQVPKASNDANGNLADQTAWGRVPSEDDESTFPSLQSTIDDTVSGERTMSIGTGTTRDNTANNQSVEVPNSKNRPGGLEKSPSHDHENFEVVLDGTLLAAGSPTRRGWFAKKDEEEKEDDVSPNFQHAEPEPQRSPEKKSLVKRLFSTRKIKKADESPKEVEVVEKERSIAKEPDVEVDQERGEGHLIPQESLRGTIFLAEPAEPIPSIEHTVSEHDDKQFLGEDQEQDDDQTKDTTLNNILNSLDDDEDEDEQPDDEISDEIMVKEILMEESKEAVNDSMINNVDESVEVDGAAAEELYAKELKSTVAKKKKTKKNQNRSLSWGLFAKKKSKDDTAVKSESNPTPTPPVKQKKAKPAWKAVVDPNSGRTYYYHRKTRETSWIMPEILKTPEETAAGESANTPARSTSKSLAVESTGREAHHQAPDGKTNPEDETPETSPVKPPMVIKAEVSAESHHRIIKAEEGMLGSSWDQGDRKAPEQSDDNWEKKKEIERLLTGVSPPDKTSMDNVMKEYEGKEDVLLKQLRDKVESQPFDEPFPELLPSVFPSPKASPSHMNARTATFLSKTSATTKSSTITDKTERIKNTFKGKSLIEPISENRSATTSLSSRHDDEHLQPITPSQKEYSASERIPSKVLPVARERELRVEELGDNRVTAETFDSKGRIVKGPAKLSENEDGSYYGDNEVDTYGDDSVSALSETDTDFLSRKDNFEQARRRALDDAIEREDWDLAAALSEGMRAANAPGDHTKAHNSWNQSELDKFIANNDWDAVKRCIARMRESKKEVEKAPPAGGLSSGTESVVKAPSRGDGVKDLTHDTSLTKRIGSKSQLQHKELLSESSWTSDSESYDSSDSEYS